jgi:hypothetical protein
MDLGARGRIQGEELVDAAGSVLFGGCGTRAAHACEERGAEACPGRFFCHASPDLCRSTFALPLCARHRYPLSSVSLVLCQTRIKNVMYVILSASFPSTLNSSPLTPVRRPPTPTRQFHFCNFTFFDRAQHLNKDLMNPTPEQA